jgi:hypothetical protein
MSEKQIQKQNRMKKTLFIVVGMVVMLATAHTSYAQGNGKMTVALKGDAEMFSEDGGKTYGISISGKTIVAPKFLDVKTTDGNYFAVNQDEKWGIVDMTGKQLIPCEYKSVSISAGGNAVLTPFSGETKLYNCATGEFVQAKEVSSDELRDMVKEVAPGTAAIDYAAMGAAANVKAAEAMVADVPEWAKFEITTENRLQQLVYKGKVVFECAEIQPGFKNKLSAGYAYYFIVKGTNGYYGTFAFAVGMQEGKVITENAQPVPFKYHYLKVTKPEVSLVILTATEAGNYSYRISWNGKKLD